MLCTHGFWKDFCITQLSEFTRDLVPALDKQHLVYCIFLDFRKAVLHSLFVEKKMVMYNFHSQVVSCITDYLTLR